MVVPAFTQKLFYHHIKRNPGLFELIKPEFFDNKDIQECFKFDIDFYNRYKKLPTKEQLKEILYHKEINNFLIKDETTKEVEFNNEKLNSIFDVDIDEYDEVYLKENLEGWITWKTFDLSIFDAISYMRGQKINIENDIIIYDDVNNYIHNDKSYIISFNNNNNRIETTTKSIKQVRH